MIDFETQIFNNVHSVVAPLCAKFISTRVISPTAFPTAALWEMDNTTVRDRQTSTPIENFALITYQGEVWAKTKAACRAVFAAMDDRMIALNFSKMSGQYVPDPDNANIVRYVARYEAMVDRDGNLYRRK